MKDKYTMAKSLQFSDEPDSVHTYPSAIQDVQDSERLFYTPFWLKFCRRNNERDLLAIAKGDTTVERRGLEILIDADYRRTKEQRYKSVMENVLQLQKEGKTLEAIAAASLQFTGLALELAQKRAEGDAEFVEEQRRLAEMEEDALCVPSWVWDACDCFSPGELKDEASATTAGSSWSLAPAPGLVVY